MLSRLVSTSRLVSKNIVQTPARYVHKGPESAPPMRYMSPTEAILRYLFLALGAMSYPTYVMYNLDSYRPRPDINLSPEMQELVDERAARRKEGKQPVLKDWPIIHAKPEQKLE